MTEATPLRIDDTCDDEVLLQDWQCTTPCGCTSAATLCGRFGLLMLSFLILFFSLIRNRSKITETPLAALRTQPGAECLPQILKQVCMQCTIRRPGPFQFLQVH